MAWRHYTIKEESLPQLSLMKNQATSHHACMESDQSSSTQAFCEGLQSDTPSKPAAPQETVSTGMRERIHLSFSQSDGPGPVMSFVTLQEQNCVISWFLGWGPSQRECFLQDLISKAVPKKICSLLNNLNNLQVRDRPPNIFQCQLRLWTQWFDTWTEEERNAFLTSLEMKDPFFVAQFYKGVASTVESD